MMGQLIGHKVPLGRNNMKKILLIIFFLLTIVSYSYATSWIRATGVSDPDTEWTDEDHLIDGIKSASNYGYDDTPSTSWSSFVYVTHSALVCDKVRWYVTSTSTIINTIDIDVYDTAWRHVYQGAFPASVAWVQKNLGTVRTITQIRVSFYNSSTQRWVVCGEVEFGQLSVPPQVTNVQATDGVHTNKVVVTWNAASGATGYDVWTGSGWVDVGNVQTYDHTTAPAPTITVGTASASDGTSSDHVTLSIAGESANNGASVDYKVRAYNLAGNGPESATNAGYRDVGSLTYQWERSSGDADADYGEIIGATTDPYNDTGAPENGDGRFYRCVENATGAAEQTTNADRGYRLAVEVLNVIFFSPAL